MNKSVKALLHGYLFFYVHGTNDRRLFIRYNSANVYTKSLVNETANFLGWNVWHWLRDSITLGRYGQGGWRSFIIRICNPNPTIVYDSFDASAEL
jgi:hypothetical protein